jgi:hypothetical protein
MTNRTCGDCSLCCKLLPMPQLSKPANKRCEHQSHARGCKIYPERPAPCRLWNCRWLVNQDTADLSRPDRSHYVIDIVPDFITMEHNETGEKQDIEVLQIWVDPNYPDAHRDPALRRYLERRGAEGVAALVRYGTREGMTIFPPQMNVERRWYELRSNMASQPEHTAEQRWKAIKNIRQQQRDAEEESAA